MLDVKLIPADLSKIHLDWEWIRQGLIECEKNSPAHILPEDTFCEIRNGKIGLYYLFTPDKNGFLIVRLLHEPYGPILYVVAFWCKSFTLHRQAALNCLLTLAKSNNAVAIRMASARPGWSRDPFFKEISRVYEHTISTA